MIDKIDNFHGEYRFLSNFFPVWVKLGRQMFPTTEHAYQAAKTKDENERMKIAQAKTPGEAKRLGRKLDIRENWEEIKYNVMYELVKQKFSKDNNLKQKLLDTDEAELIEGNTWGDQEWGVYKGKGKNLLGLILMEVREKLRKE